MWTDPTQMRKFIEEFRVFYHIYIFNMYVCQMVIYTHMYV